MFTLAIKDFHMWADGDVPFFRVPFWDFVPDLWVYFQRPRRINGYPLKDCPGFLDTQLWVWVGFLS